MRKIIIYDFKVEMIYRMKYQRGKKKTLWRARRKSKRTCDQNPEMEKVIDPSMVEVCAEESVSPEQDLFCFSLLLSLS